MAANVLAVCTMNQCRSPMIELLLRRAVTSAPVLDWSISSAGTRAVDGRPVLPFAADVLMERGLNAQHFTARRLTRSIIADADLVLTAEPEHRAAVLSLHHGALHHTFTIAQFVRLLQTTIPDEAVLAEWDGVAWLVERARIARPYASSGNDTLRDPAGKSQAHFEAVAATVASSVEAIAGVARARLRLPRHTLPQIATH